MRSQSNPRQFSRRELFKLGGGMLTAVAASYLMPDVVRNVLLPVRTTQAASGTPDLHLASTDGWIYLPRTPAFPPYHPDALAPAPFTTYMFGFRDVTGLSETQIRAQKMKAQHMAPLFWADEYDPATGANEFRLRMQNLGLAMRPDLTDPHTVHWHGFRNQIPFFDGEPMGSLSVPIGRTFDYVYRARDAGTYMYHCHVEDIEHVHMGMTGVVFVRPRQNGNTTLCPSGKYAYNDGDGTTGYDREFVVFLSEVWAESHWDDAHIQLPDWTTYRPDFYLLNGRVYPDTLEANGPGTDPATGDLLPPTSRPELQYQPDSGLIQANAGERVLLRFVNLGFWEQSMTLAGLKMKVVGKDAGLLRRGSADQSYETNTISIGPGESYDVIIRAPLVASKTTYLLYNRNYNRLRNGSGTGYGGQMTEVRVYPPGTLSPQLAPHTYDTSVG